MTRSRLAVLVVLASTTFAPAVSAAEPLKEADENTRIRDAVLRGLPVVRQAADNYPKNRKCFSCHHQTLPMLAVRDAARYGVDAEQVVPATFLPAQFEFTAKSFAAKLDSLRAGTGIGGQAMTVAFALWTYELADAPAGETSEAMVAYLLKTQREDGSWGFQTDRPPLEASRFTSTVLAAYGIDRYQGQTQREPVKSAVDKARAWLDRAEIKQQEDRAMRLWGLKRLGGSEEQLAAARKTVLEAQRPDGSWAQLDSMSGDAYSTGQALWVLKETGFAANEAAYRRGAKFLLDTQHADGSWLVETRSRPIQAYFDNGDPHGKHQFISTPATCWALAALAAMLPPK
jgi:N-acyl-D-amino-acid deacylase